MGEEVFGAYFVLFNFSILYQIVLDFGLQQYNSKEIAQDSQKLHTYFINFLASKIVLSLLFVALAIPTFFLLGYSWQHFGNLILLLLSNQILISFIFYLRSNLSGLHKFKLDTMFSVLDKVIMIGLGSIMLYFNFLDIVLNIFNFALIQTIAFSINALILLLVVGQLAIPFKFNLDINLIKSTIRKSTLFALSIFLMSIYLKMDVIMIERLLGEKGAYEAGVYAQSFRIIDALNMIGILFANILLPTYAKLLAKEKSVVKLLKQAVILLNIIILPIALIMIIKSNFIIHLLYVNGSAYSASILSILILSFVSYNIMHIFSSLLTVANQLKKLNIIFGIGILFNLISNFILIPDFGARGAAITTSISEMLVLVGIIIVTAHYLKNNSK